LKKVQGKKKKDKAAGEAAGETRQDNAATEAQIPEDEATVNMLGTKDEDVIF